MVISSDSEYEETQAQPGVLKRQSQSEVYQGLPPSLHAPTPVVFQGGRQIPTILQGLPDPTVLQQSSREGPFLSFDSWGPFLSSTSLGPSLTSTNPVSLLQANPYEQAQKRLHEWDTNLDQRREEMAKKMKPSSVQIPGWSL